MHHFINLCFLVLSCLEFRQVMSKRCDFNDVKKCNEIIRDLPFYGPDEAHFNTTCELLGTAVECVTDFANRCTGDPDCDDNCKLLMAAAKASGFEEVHDKMCTIGSEYRASYLKYYACFNTSADKYDECHRTSDVSMRFIDNRYTREIKCCLFSWYKACLVNATQVTCGHEAALVTKWLFDVTLNHFLNNCEGEKPCLQPPLPNESEGDIVEEFETDTAEKSDTTEESATIEPTEKEVAKRTSGASGILVASNIYNIMRHFLILRLMFNFVIYY